MFNEFRKEIDFGGRPLILKRVRLPDRPMAPLW